MGNGKNFKKLLKIIHSRGADIKIFVENRNEVTSLLNAWYELIFCILAGTKISTKVAFKAYENILSNHFDEAFFANIVLNKKSAEKKIAKTLKKSGYRFYNSKSKTIVEAAEYFMELENLNLTSSNPFVLRENLTKNVNGIGYKIASHWLRNLGFEFPVVDIHVKRLLFELGLIKENLENKNLTKTDYIQIENEVIEISEKIGEPPSVVDFALWLHGSERRLCCKL